MSVEPMHVQIRNWLVAQIESGELAEGTKLPSEYEIAAQFGVSRPTARQAVQTMANDGLVQRARGRGTTVLGRRREYPIRRLVSFTEEHADSGQLVASEVLDQRVEPADGRLMDLLEIAEGAEVFSLGRLRRVDGQPAAWQLAHIPIGYVPGIEALDFSIDSLYRVLAQRYGLAVNHGDEVINVGGASRKEAELLQIPVSEPVFRIDRRSYLASGRMLEFVESVYRADQYDIRLRLVR